MRDDRETTDAATTTGRGYAQRVGEGAIALLAIGAPFAAATPAGANGNGRGNGHANAGCRLPRPRRVLVPWRAGVLPLGRGCQHARPC